MRNYSRKFRRNYKGGVWPLDTPQEEVVKAKAAVEDANKKLAEAEAKAAAAPPDASVSMTDKLKSMSPFGGGAPSGLAAASDSLTSGVKSVGSNVTSGVKSLMPASLKGGRSNRQRRQSRKNRQSNKNRRR